MNWRVFIANSAKKQLRQFPPNDLKRISLSIDQLAFNPFVGDVVKLEGRGNVWRRRLGNYRIIFELFPKERVIFIYDITRRTSSTY
jgi:mRNA interferase RelE/StbE